VFEVEPLLFTLYQLNGSSTSLDQLAAGPEWTQVRIAKDETLWLGPPSAALDPAFASSVAELEREACLCDVTDGWAGIVLRESTRLQILAWISPLRVQSREDRIEVVQGDVLGLPAKVLSSRSAVLILFPATAFWYVGACLADLRLGLDDAPAVEWSISLMAPTPVESPVSG
jgi:hypothetical protein